MEGQIEGWREGERGRERAFHPVFLWANAHNRFQVSHVHGRSALTWAMLIVVFQKMVVQKRMGLETVRLEPASQRNGFTHWATVRFPDSFAPSYYCAKFLSNIFSFGYRASYTIIRHLLRLILIMYLICTSIVARALCHFIPVRALWGKHYHYHIMENAMDIQRS